MSDSDIIRGFLRGDPQCVDLIDSWIRQVVQARLWTHGIPPEDITSDTFLKLLVNFRGDKFRYGSSLKTYVQRITRFTIIDHVRSHRRAREYVQESRISDVEADNPGTLFEGEEEVLIYKRILSIVGSECKDLWKMIFNDEMSYKEIAKTLGTTEGAVKTRVLRCKQKAVALGKKMI